jgi:hypothetical protein
LSFKYIFSNIANYLHKNFKNIFYSLLKFLNFNKYSKKICYYQILIILLGRKILCVSKSFSYQKSAKFKVSRETDKNAPHWVCSFAVFDCLQAFCRAFGKLLNKQRFTPIFIWLFGKYKLNPKIQMTHNHTYLQNLLNLLGFEHKISTIYSKTYAQHQHYTITVNFETEKIAYPEPINLGDKTTSHFEASENFVVLECVNRLLEQGYKPENITLEKKWKLGHNTKGKVDVFVQYPENYLPNTEKMAKHFYSLSVKLGEKNLIANLKQH